jgi:hypothetical protein
VLLVAARAPASLRDQAQGTRRIERIEKEGPIKELNGQPMAGTAVHVCSWHFSDLADESSVGLLCRVKRTYSHLVPDLPLLTHKRHIAATHSVRAVKC